MKRHRDDEPNVYFLKLRLRRYARYSTSAWGCRNKKYPVEIVWHATDPKSVGYQFKDISHASEAFGLEFHTLHMMIKRQQLVNGRCILTYKKFL